MTQSDPAPVSRRFGPLKTRQILSIPVWIFATTLIVLPSGIIPAILAMLLAARLGALTLQQRNVLMPKLPPVLYLRSFDVDRTSFFTPSEEEILSPIFGTLGPMIAIERPGERLPNIGASRIASDDNTWQNLVDELSDEASVIVMQIGTTPGFLWEFAHVVEHCDPRKVVLVQPFETRKNSLTETYSTFRAMAKPHISHPFPDFETSPKEIPVIAFDDAWKPSAAKVKPPNHIWWQIPIVLYVLYLGVLTPFHFYPVTSLFAKVSVGVGAFFLFLCYSLIIMRPARAWMAGKRISRALSHVSLPETTRIAKAGAVGRIPIAFAAFLGPQMALPLVAYNFLIARRKVVAVICLALGLIFYLASAQNITFNLPFGPDHISPIKGVSAFYVALILWPFFTPLVIRRHLAFGGDALPLRHIVVFLSLALYFTLSQLSQGWIEQSGV